MMAPLARIPWANWRPRLLDCLGDYGRRALASDLLAGLTVGVVALGGFLLELAEHREGLVQVGEEVLPQQVEHLNQHRIADGVEDLVAGFPVHQDVLGAQHREVLRQVRLLDVEQVEQLARGQLAVAERLDDGDAGGVGQRLEDLGLELPKRVLHVDKYIRLIECSCR